MNTHLVDVLANYQLLLFLTSDSLNYFHNWLCLQNLHKQKYIKDSYSYY